MENTELEIIESGVSTEIQSAETETTEMQEENMVIETPLVEVIDYTETMTLIQQNADYIPTIASDVRVILVFVVLTFCWSCMRSWRNHVIRG